MASKVSVSDADFNTLRQNIDRFNGEFDAEMEQAILQGAEIIVEDAKSRVTVDTGKLRDSLGSKIHKTAPGYVNADAGYVNTDQFGPDKDRYFIYYELGSSHQKARAPLRKAKTATRNRVKAAVQQPLEKFLKK